MEDNNIDFESMIKKATSTRDMNKIIFTTDEDENILFEIVASFKSKANKKIYYVMTDNTKNNKGELNISIFYINYDESKPEPSESPETFYPVIDDNELNMVYDSFANIPEFA